jgi:hypothetical protein
MKQTRWFVVLFFLVLARPALADECLPPWVLQSDGTCTYETVLDIAPLVDIDPNPFQHIYIYDTYPSFDPVFVSGMLPESALQAAFWTLHTRPALNQLKSRVETTLAQQLGVPVDDVLRRSAHGQLNSLLYIMIMEIINTPAADRDDFEQRVYADVQEAFSDRRRHVAHLAAEQYNLWRDHPCGYQVPVGDDPNAYLSQYAVSSYCLNAEFGNVLALAFTTTPAIPSGAYLSWATQLRMQSLMTYWASLGPDDSAAAYVNAYTDTQQGMAYHLAWGTLSSLPGFDFNDIYSDAASQASIVQNGVAQFVASYYRDYLPTVLLNLIFTGPDGMIPDLWDIAIFAAAGIAHATLEIIDQAESWQGIDAALARSAQSLEVATSSDVGRSELLMMLVELGMPDLLDYRVVLPGHDTPVPGVFYSTQSPQSDQVQLEDWGTDYFLDDVFNAQYIFSDQEWLSRSLGGAIDIANPRYDGFTSHTRFVTPEGDFATAWLVKGRNDTYRQFLVTPYARLLRDWRTSTDTEARVRVERRYNNDCPAQSSYPSHTNLTDHGMSCVVIENGVFISGRTHQDDLAPGDSIIIAGRVATIQQLYYTDTVPSYATSFSTVEPVVESGILSNQVVHKIELGGGSGVPTDRFAYRSGDGGTATAILDFTSLPPQIAIANPELMAEANAVLSVVDLGEVTATDPTEGAVAVSSDAPAAFPLGTTTVTYTASDSAGNSATATQTVTVVDTTVPHFPALPLARSVEATADPMPVTLDPPQATDIFAVTVVSDAPAGGFPLGDTIVAWTATDVSGNSAGVLQIVTITDTTPPLFTTVPADFTLEATGPLTAVNPGVAMATDVFGVTVSHDVSAAGLAVGTHPVTWTAVDANGNQTQATQTVTVADTTPPLITLEHPSTQVEASAVSSLVELGTATALDLVDGEVAVDHDAPAAFSLGTTVVTYTAVDSRGNQSTVTQSVTVVDTTPPEFTTLPLDIDRIAAGPYSTLDLGSVEATDIFAVTIANDAPATLPVGTTVVTWTATDASGNTAMVTQTVHLSYQFGGFEKPVVANGVYKVNRVLPLRIGLTYADGTVAETAQAWLSVAMVQNGEEESDPLVIDAAGAADSGSRFQLRGGSFQYNLETSSLASGIYRLAVTLDDDNRYTIDIALKQ